MSGDRVRASVSVAVEPRAAFSIFTEALRVHFTWRNANFAPQEQTQVEVEFIAQTGGTMVTVTHLGLGKLRPDHPARHGLHGSEFSRMIGLWWGDQLTAFRLRCALP